MRDDDVKIVSSSLTIKSPSIAESSKESPSDFIKDRFYAMSVSHNSALITGSSLAHQQKSLSKEPVLDAGAMSFTKNRLGINIGIRQATADGLGGSPDDDMENASIAQISSYACQCFIESKAASAPTYHFIAQSSDEHALFQNSQQQYDSQCAMASAAFTYSGKGKYQGELSNMGDTLLLVLSHDLKIKKIVPARHIYRGMGMWTPASVQMLQKTHSNAFISETYEAQEGDVIISMTDGIWSELDLSPCNEQKEMREFTVNEAKFESLFKTASLSAHCSAYEIGSTLLNKAIECSLKKRNLLQTLVNELIKIPLPSNKITVDEVLKILGDGGQQETAKQLSNLLFNNHGDGIVYKQGVDIPFLYVLKDLQSRTAGDCSTINVTRVPYPADECIRALLKTPKKVRDLLSVLFREVSSEEDIKESIKRLKMETVLKKSGLLFGELETEKNITDSLLEDIEQILLSIYQIKAILKTTLLYDEQLHQIDAVMEPLRKSIKGCVFQLIKEDVAPSHSFLNFFRSREKNTFTKFASTYAPGVALDEILKSSDHKTIGPRTVTA